MDLNNNGNERRVKQIGRVQEGGEIIETNL